MLKKFYLFYCLIVAIFLVFTASCSSESKTSKKEKEKTEDTTTNNDQNQSLEDLLDIDVTKLLDNNSNTNDGSGSDNNFLSTLASLLNNFLSPDKTPGSSDSLIADMNLDKLKALLSEDDLFDESDFENIRDSLSDNEISDVELDSIKDFLAEHNIPTDKDSLTDEEQQNILDWVQNNQNLIRERLLSQYDVDVDTALINQIANRLYNSEE